MGGELELPWWGRSQYGRAAPAPSRPLPSLSQRGYFSPDAFLADLRLICSNAKRYNCPPGWLPTRDSYLPSPEEVRAKAPQQWADAPVYRLAWDLERRIDAAEPALRAAWRAQSRAAKRRVLAAAGIMPPPSP